jgi:alpha-glucosidase (family GH31 glycosyl hydrolase)
VYFRAATGERIFGLGQHQHGLLDNKGSVIDLEQRNTEVSIPFYLSSLGYGFLWNNPGVGRVELGNNATRWVMEATRGIDYYIVAGDTPAEIMEKYVDATGHPPLLPDFALGFWQCKLRYRTQEEMLAVVREYRRRGLPLAVIVSDYFHWHMMGEWAMDPRDWPDPIGLTRELKEMGVELMVSIWPTVNRNSEAFHEMAERGLLAQTEHGVQAHMGITDTTPEGISLVTFYDATNPKRGSTYGRRSRRTIWTTACVSSGWTPTSRSWYRSTPTTSATRWGAGWKWAASTRCCTKKAFTWACAPPGRRRSSISHARRGLEHSAMARRSGRAISARALRCCVHRSRPG